MIKNVRPDMVGKFGEGPVRLSHSFVIGNELGGGYERGECNFLTGTCICVTGTVRCISVKG